MDNTLNEGIHADHQKIYQIRIRGHLGPQWTDWFEGMAVTPDNNGDTVLTGPVIDQAALHGLLKRVRDLGLPLLSMMEVVPTQRDPPGAG